MSDLNSVTVIGRLTADPEIRYTPTGTANTKLLIANNEQYTQNNEKKEHTNFFEVNVWGNQAVNCDKYLKKGKLIAVEGVLKQNRWQDKESGQNRSKIEITAKSVQFLSPMDNSDQSNNQYKDNGFDDPWAK